MSQIAPSIIQITALNREIPVFRSLYIGSFIYYNVYRTRIRVRVYVCITVIIIYILISSVEFINGTDRISQQKFLT